jgi:small-conductance mechanosensitive channel
MDGVVEWFRGQMESPGNLVRTGLLLGVLVVIRFLVLRAVGARMQHGEVYFRTRKWVAYAVTLVGGLGLINIWLGGVGGIGTYLGILSAGIAIALAEVLENLAGWAFIVVRRPFKVGDRIEIGGTSGDVVDVRAFRFSMLEVGNWVEAEQSTGRLIHVPNGKVFSEHVANYTEGFPYLWDEIGVLVTFESDWERAEQLVAGAMAEHAPDPDEGSIKRAIREAGQQYLIRYTHVAPATYISARDSGVMVSGRYMVGVRQRRSVQDALWRSLLHAIAAEPAVELAYPTTRTYLPDPIFVRDRDRTPPDPDPASS